MTASHLPASAAPYFDGKQPVGAPGCTCAGTVPSVPVYRGLLDHLPACPHYGANYWRAQMEDAERAWLAALPVSPADPTREEAPEREPLMIPYSLPDHPCDCGGRVFHSAQTGQERCLSCGGRRYVSAPTASPGEAGEGPDPIQEMGVALSWLLGMRQHVTMGAQDNFIRYHKRATSALGTLRRRLSSQSDEIARLRWERDEARRQAAFAERANAANHQAWKDAEELLQEARAVSNRFVMRADAAESQLARLRAWVDRFPEPSATEIRLTPVTNEGALPLATSFIARIGDWRREGVALFASPSPGDPT